MSQTPVIQEESGFENSLNANRDYSSLVYRCETSRVRRERVTSPFVICIPNYTSLPIITVHNSAYGYLSGNNWTILCGILYDQDENILFKPNPKAD